MSTTNAGTETAGKRGDEIHLGARIIALIDAYNALCQSRAYRQAWPVDRIVAELQAQSGEHFDPALVSLFIDNLDSFEKIRRECSESECSDAAPA